MKRYLLTLLAFALLILPCAVWGATYYVSSSCEHAGNGTTGSCAASPGAAGAWKTIVSVNSNVSGNGDAVYFKCGDEWNTITDARLYIDWPNPTVGAYYMAGGAGTETVGVSGTKPKLDGQYTGSTPSTSTVIIDVASTDATVQDLWLTRSRGYGLRLKTDAARATVQRCVVDHTQEAGIYNNCVTGGSSFLYNDISEFGLGYIGVNYWPAGIRLRSNDRAAFNRVHDGNGEGINGYDCANWIVEYNKIWNCWSAHIYFDSVDDCIARYNMIFGTTDTTYMGYGHAAFHFYGIMINAESNTSGGSNRNQIYGNFVAGTFGGIRIQNTDTDNGTGNLIYNNTFVDNRYNFTHTEGTTATNLASIYNNLFILTGESKSGVTPAQTIRNNAIHTFGENFWSADPAHTGYGTTTNGTHALSKSTGWLAIANEAGVAIGDFAITALSDAINSAPSLSSGYGASYITTGSDYTDPIAPVTTSQWDNPADNATPWDFGGWIYYDQADPAPPAECLTDYWTTPVNEAFEGTNCASDTCTFCSDGPTLGAQGCSDVTTGTVIDCASSDWAHTGSASLKMVLDSDTSDGAFKFVGTAPASQTQLWLRWYVKTGTSTGTEAESTSLPSISADSSNAEPVVAVRWLANSGAWKVYLREGANYSSNYFNLSAATVYRMEIHAVDNNTCTLKIFDSSGDAVLNDGGIGDTITLAGADQADVQFIHFYDNYTSSTAATFYFDDFEMSTADWVGALGEDADVTDPTVTAIGVWNGTSCEQNVTDTWGAETVTICMALSEDVIVSNSAVAWTMTAGPNSTDTTAGTYLRKTYSGATAVLLMDFTFVPKMRKKNPQMSLASGGVIEDDAGNSIDFTNSEGDLDGTGTIKIAVASISDNPFTIGTNTEEDSFEYATLTALKAATTIEDGDNFNIGTVTESGAVSLADDDCTEADPCSITLSGDWTQAGAGLTMGDWYSVTGDHNLISGTVKPDHGGAFTGVEFTAVNLANVGTGETVTFTGCLFNQDRATVEATLGDGTALFPGCKFGRTAFSSDISGMNMGPKMR